MIEQKIGKERLNSKEDNVSPDFRGKSERVLELTMYNNTQKQRTVASIPNPKKKERTIGPWSYSPKDDFVKHKASGVLFNQESTNNLPSF